MSKINEFYSYEGFLATSPIISFMRRHGCNYNGTLLDVGCGEGPYKKYFTNIDNYIGLDSSGLSNTITADINKELPISDGQIDVALCTQVLEHIEETGHLMREMNRVLKIGGALILSAPQMGRLHGEPNDFYRFTKWGLKHILEKNGFEIKEIVSHGGIFRALGSHINFFIIECSHRILRMILRRTIVVVNNIIFSSLDTLIKWDKDTLGYNVIAVKVK